MSIKVILAPIVAIIFCCSFSCNSVQKTNTEKVVSENAISESNEIEDAKTTETKQAASSDDVSRVVVKAIGNTMSEMAFDPKVIKVKAGTKVELTLVNLGSDAMMVHNLLVVKKGTADAVGVAAIKAGASKNYVPDHPGVIAASELAKPLKKTVMEFDAPPAGDYVFVCTYPGHHLTMRGRFVVE